MYIVVHWENFVQANFSMTFKKSTDIIITSHEIFQKLGSVDINLVRDGQKPKKNLALTNNSGRSGFKQLHKWASNCDAAIKFD